MNNSVSLFRINKDVKCIKCGHIGAVQSYGRWYERGLGDKVDEFGDLVKPLMEKYRDNSYMSHTMGFGGTIPWECTNCGNRGLINYDRLEGYIRAFEKIEGENDK